MLARLLGRKVCATLSLTLALALTGACGGGGTTTVQGFFLQAIGPAGGVAAAGDVHLTIPPGALALDTGVGILLEPGTFAISPEPPDGCEYSYLGPIWCCGPVGLPLIVPGQLRLTYDESLIPGGRTEADLVLLIWDNIAGVMRPTVGPDVIHDTVNNVFIYGAYPELGHIAVGVRFCVGNILVHDGDSLVEEKPASGSTQGGGPRPTLWVVDPLEVQPPSQVVTNGLDFDEFLANPLGNRVLLRVPGFSQEEQVYALWTTPLGAPGAPVPLAFDDPDNGRFLEPYDPLFGWLAASPSEAFYITSHFPLQPSSTPTQNEYELWRRIGDSSAAPTLVHARPRDNVTVNDMRQSFATTPLMLRTFDYLNLITAAAFIGSPTGAPIHFDGAIPSNTNLPSPQFFHGTPVLNPARFAQLGQPEVYMITDATTVSFFAIDGTPAGSYSVGDSEFDTLRHFAVAPDDEHWAAIVDTGFFEEQQTAQSLGGTELWMGTFTDGVLATTPLGFVGNVNELVWHPFGDVVFADLGYGNVHWFALEQGKGFFISQDYIPIPSLTHLDVNRIDGRILILIPESFNNDLRTGGQLGPGLFISPAYPVEFDGPVDMGPSISDPQNARWVDSWRLQPGQNSGGTVR